MIIYFTCHISIKSREIKYILKKRMRLKHPQEVYSEVKNRSSQNQFKYIFLPQKLQEIG